MLPNFIIVGAARSGTTSLYRYCSEHPAIFMSPVKETNFFSSNPSGFTRRSYERLFEKSGDATAIGEASPSYLYDETSPSAIKASVPECRIVVVLRNPVERLISDFFYGQSWGSNLDVDLSTFVTACLAGEQAGRQGFVPALTAKKGLYAEQVGRYLDLFKPERVFIRLYEDLQSDAVRTMSELYAFLDVDPSFTPRFTKVHNANSEPVFPLWSKIVRRSRGIEAALLNPLLPCSMRGGLTRSLLAINRRALSELDPRRSVSPEIRERLLDFYRGNVEALQRVIERDLGSWLK